MANNTWALLTEGSARESENSAGRNGRRRLCGRRRIPPNTRIRSSSAALSTGRRAAHHSDEIQDALETRTKGELIELLLDAVASDVDLLARVRAAADSDVARRKVFAHGLGRDATREALLEAFCLYGSVEECNLVIDKATGHAKGYGFVLFLTCSGAIKAPKQPQKMIDRRLVFCQLSANNVPAVASSEKLRSFFSQFGEVERGPLGFDLRTGRSRGYAIFAYKTLEGARKALEEPFKMFEGHQLYCAKVAASSQKKKAPATSTTSPAALLAPAPQPVLAAVAAAQNLMIHRQNPTYASLLGHHPAAVPNTISGVTGFLSLPGRGLGVGWASEVPSILGPFGSQRELPVCLVHNRMASCRSSGGHHPRGLAVSKIASSDCINNAVRHL